MIVCESCLGVLVVCFEMIVLWYVERRNCDTGKYGLMYGKSHSSFLSIHLIFRMTRVSQQLT